MRTLGIYLSPCERAIITHPLQKNLRTHPQRSYPHPAIGQHQPSDKFLYNSLVHIHLAVETTKYRWKNLAWNGSHCSSNIKCSWKFHAPLAWPMFREKLSILGHDIVCQLFHSGASEVLLRGGNRGMSCPGPDKRGPVFCDDG